MFPVLFRTTWRTSGYALAQTVTEFDTYELAENAIKALDAYQSNLHKTTSHVTTLPHTEAIRLYQ
jgi:hypothetical protein